MNGVIRIVRILVLLHGAVGTLHFEELDDQGRTAGRISRESVTGESDGC